MGDVNVRCPVATHFEHGVDVGLIVPKSPFMADEKDPLVLNNYIFELLDVSSGVAGFLIQVHREDVHAVLESVTVHAEKGAGRKTTLYVHGSGGRGGSGGGGGGGGSGGGWEGEGQAPQPPHGYYPVGKDPTG